MRAAPSWRSAEAGPWFLDFHTATTTYVVFSGRIFNYKRDELEGRDNVIAQARAVAVPEPQVDWTERLPSQRQRVYGTIDRHAHVTGTGISNSRSLRR